MTLDELAQLLHGARGGASVELTAITVPPAGPSIYGIVTIGKKEYQRVIHSVEELRDVLERFNR